MGQELREREWIEPRRGAFLEAVSSLTRDQGGDLTDLVARGASLLALPYGDTAVDAAYVFDVQAHVAADPLDAVIAELGRAIGGSLFLHVSRAAGAPLAWMGREDWERRFVAAGWSRHPLYQRLTPYEQLEREDHQTMILAFERLPRAVRHAYAIDWLATERDLHMDMLRETGRRSDAHVARYALAAQFVREGDRILDAACGLGYGAAVLHDSVPHVSIRGLDLSDSAVDYARLVFASRRPRVSFDVGDVLRVAEAHESSLDVITSFETLEHLEEPDAFVAAAARALAPGGRFICSVPNRWVDETGQDPNPFHLHVFDLDRLTQLLRPHLQIDRVLAQFAGGGMVHRTASRRFVPVPPGDPDDAEWWVVVATRADDGDRRTSRTDRTTTIDRGDRLAAECRRGERERHELRVENASLTARLDAQRARTIARAIADVRGIVIFGAGEGGRQAAAWWRGQGGRVAAFTDNRAPLWGGTIEGAPVIAPAALPQHPAALILIASSTGAVEIGVQLEAMGLCRDVDFTTR